MEGSWATAMTVGRPLHCERAQGSSGGSGESAGVHCRLRGRTGSLDMEPWSLWRVAGGHKPAPRPVVGYGQLHGWNRAGASAAVAGGQLPRSGYMPSELPSFQLQVRIISSNSPASHLVPPFYTFIIVLFVPFSSCVPPYISSPLPLTGTHTRTPRLSKVRLDVTDLGPPGGEAPRERAHTETHNGAQRERRRCA